MKFIPIKKDTYQSYDLQSTYVVVEGENLRPSRLFDRYGDLISEKNIAVAFVEEDSILIPNLPYIFLYENYPTVLYRKDGIPYSAIVIIEEDPLGSMQTKVLSYSINDLFSALYAIKLLNIGTVKTIDLSIFGKMDPIIVKEVLFQKAIHRDQSRYPTNLNNTELLIYGILHFRQGNSLPSNVYFLTRRAKDEARSNYKEIALTNNISDGQPCLVLNQCADGWAEYPFQRDYFYPGNKDGSIEEYFLIKVTDSVTKVYTQIVQDYSQGSVSYGPGMLVSRSIVCGYRDPASPDHPILAKTIDIGHLLPEFKGCYYIQTPFITAVKVSCVDPTYYYDDIYSLPVGGWYYDDLGGSSSNKFYWIDETILRDVITNINKFRTGQTTHLFSQHGFKEEYEDFFNHLLRASFSGVLDALLSNHPKSLPYYQSEVLQVTFREIMDFVMTNGVLEIINQNQDDNPTTLYYAEIIKIHYLNRLLEFKYMGPNHGMTLYQIKAPKITINTQ